MKRLLLGAALAVSIAAFAHPFGAGPGPGSGPGYGMRHGPGFGAGLMTPEERRAPHDAMHNFTDEAQCRAYMEAHHVEMQARAQERGVTLPSHAPGPRSEAPR